MPPAPHHTAAPGRPHRVFLLTNLASPHSIKWVRGLCLRGYAIEVFSLSPYDPNIYADLTDFKGHTLALPDSFVKTASGRFQKLRYLGAVGKIRRLIREAKPDLVHAHRASSYGLLATLTGTHPRIISVWGDDVYVFPEQSWLFRRLIVWVLDRADRVLSTSAVMARQTAKFTDHDIQVTPFGIDMELFSPEGRRASGFDDRELIIGTIKTLEPKYGIDLLIRAFAQLAADERIAELDRPLRLLVVGTGSQASAYIQLAEELGVSDHVTFTGRIPFAEVADYHRRIDIFAALSTIDAESFGVAIVEASATSTPVVVSDAGGPAEVVEDGETGFVVPRSDVDAAAAALLRLVLDADLRRRMGEAGRAHVRAHYEWEDNLTTMEEIYQSVCQ